MSMSEEEITEVFEEARAKGEVTDLLDNPVDDFTEVDATWSKKDHVMGTVLPQIKFLQGRVLTIVDATYDDKERAKYVKDLIKDAFVSQADSILQVTIDAERES